MSSNLFQLRQRVAASGHSLPFMVVIALPVLSCECSTLIAAPVTFAFEVTVDSVFPGAPFDSEIDLAEGDVITGQFTFEPNAGDGNSPFMVNQLLFRRSAFQYL